MPAMTKEQYWRSGRKAGDANDPPARLKPGTWQAGAYNRGYVNIPLDAPVEALAAAQRTRGTRTISTGAAEKPVGGVHLDRMAANTRGWPGAAAQHALALARDLNAERNPARRKRLHSALSRMQRRHGRPADPLDVPMTTQPCPEGPVTVRDILQGR